MNVERQVTINASADKVWDIVGTKFNDIAKWASFVYESHGNPDLEPGEGRVCETQFGPVVENMKAFDATQRTLTHTILGQSTPPFMKDILNIWKIEPQGEGQSLITFGIEARVLPPFKQLLSGRLKKRFGKQAEGYINELKYFAENDLPKA